MEQRRLGNTDLTVSVVCLGTMTWGEQNSEADGHAQLDHATAHGINFVDTAEMYAVPPREETYGRTEEIIGSWLKKTGRRDDIVLATKIASRSPRFPYVRPHIDKVPRLDPRSVREACEASLKRLQTDYIDLYQVHWPERATNFFGELRYHQRGDDGVPLEETLGAMADLVKEGKVRHIGLSNESAWGVMHALELYKTKGLPKVQSVQNPYSLLNRSYEVGLSEVSIREECGLLAYSPLGFGVLTGKYRNGAKPAGARLTLYGSAMTRYQSPEARAATESYLDLADKEGLDPAIMALAFCHRQPFLTSTIIGATSIPQLEVAIKSADVKLSNEVIKAIDAIDNRSPFPAP